VRSHKPQRYLRIRLEATYTMIHHSLCTNSTSRGAECEAASLLAVMDLQFDGQVLRSSIPADNQRTRPSEHHAWWWQLNDPLQQGP
jgi:hypothetical protein